MFLPSPPASFPLRELRSVGVPDDQHRCDAFLGVATNHQPRSVGVPADEYRLDKNVQAPVARTFLSVRRRRFLPCVALALCR